MKKEKSKHAPDEKRKQAYLLQITHFIASSLLHRNILSVSLIFYSTIFNQLAQMGLLQWFTDAMLTRGAVSKLPRPP